MAFIDNIPAYHEAMLKELTALEGKVADTYLLLEAHYQAEEFAGHDCDCEYCESQGIKRGDIMPPELFEATEKEAEKHKINVDEHKAAVRRLERYSDAVKRPIAKIKRLKN